jgi:uncharacterized membrane protein YjfL (UPF0719 family)
MEIMLINVVMFVLISAVTSVSVHAIASWRFKRSLMKTGVLLSDEEHQPALALRRAGLYAGALIGAAAIAKNASDWYLSGALDLGHIGELLASMALLLGFMFTALKAADWLLLSNVNNDRAIANNNLAVGIAEGGILLATGLVAYGSLLGEGHLLSSVVFFVVGQAVFIVVAYAMEYVIHPSHSAKSDLENGCVRSAALVVSMFLAVGLFVQNGIAGDFYGYARDIPYFLKLLGLQLALFGVYLWLIEFIMLRMAGLSLLSNQGVCFRVMSHLSIAYIIASNVSL